MISQWLRHTGCPFMLQREKQGCTWWQAGEAIAGYPTIPGWQCSTIADKHKRCASVNWNPLLHWSLIETLACLGKLPSIRDMLPRGRPQKDGSSIPSRWRTSLVVYSFWTVQADVLKKCKGSSVCYRAPPASFRDIWASKPRMRRTFPDIQGSRGVSGESGEVFGSSAAWPGPHAWNMGIRKNNITT